MEATWLNFAVVLASGVPAAVAAYFGYRSAQQGRKIKQQLVTGNDKTVGEMVTEVHGKESAQETGYETHG